MPQYQHHIRAQNCIAQSYLTNSKRPESLVKGVYPTHLARGRGCYAWDHEGKRYLDFICGLGTSILGYAHERVNAAITDQLANGASLSLATHVELDAAEKLKELFPSVDCVKFLKTGSEACSAAIRIARTKTARLRVISEGYHGWHDAFVSLTPPALGVPPCLTEKLDSSSLTDVNLSTVAAVILEPIITDVSPERIDWLRRLREDCTRNGVMLIFDEVITGFRFPKFSASNYFGIEPDIIILGKAIANGMPLAALGGKYSIMNCDEYFVSSSYGGECLSLAAATETMKLLQTKYDLAWLWWKGQAFLKEFNELWPGKLWIEGYPTRGVLKGEPLTKGLFMQEACKAGMLFGPSWFFNFPLADEMQDAMGQVRAIVGRIQRGEAVLTGELPKSPFAQRVREQ